MNRALKQLIKDHKWQHKLWMFYDVEYRKFNRFDYQYYRMYFDWYLHLHLQALHYLPAVYKIHYTLLIPYYQMYGKALQN